MKQIKHEVQSNCLLNAVSIIDSNAPLPVKVGAFRALSQLLPAAENESSQLGKLGSLLATFLLEVLKASKEAPHLVVESSQAAKNSSGEATAAKEVLKTIRNAPRYIVPLLSQFLGPILSNPQQQQEGLVARSLDLITMLLKDCVLSSRDDIIKSVYLSCFNPIVKIVLDSDDHSEEIQNATECLALYVYGGRKELLAWDVTASKCLQDVLSRLLKSNLQSSGSFAVGKYILQLILHMSHMSQHTAELYTGLVSHMNSSAIAGGKILSFLADTLIQNQEQATNAEAEIHAAMSLWAYLLKLERGPEYLESLMNQGLTEPQRQAIISLHKKVSH